MNNINIYKDYIQKNVINHLERLMNGGNQSGDLDLFEQYPSQGGYVPKDAFYKSELHEMMEPYYKMYLFGAPRLCKPNMESIRFEMKRIIDDDDLFGRWASEQDLITSAECWGDNMKRINEAKRIYQYFYILEALLRADCCQDWSKLSKELKRDAVQVRGV